MNADFHAEIKGWGAARDLEQLTDRVLGKPDNAEGSSPIDSEARVKRMCGVMLQVFSENKDQVDRSDVLALRNISKVMDAAALEADGRVDRQVLGRVKIQIEKTLNTLNEQRFPSFPAVVFNEMAEFLSESDQHRLVQLARDPDIEGVPPNTPILQKTIEQPRDYIQSMTPGLVQALAEVSFQKLDEQDIQLLNRFFHYASPQQQMVFFKHICRKENEGKQAQIVFIIELLGDMNNVRCLNLRHIRDLMGEDHVKAIVSSPLGLENLGLSGGVNEKSMTALVESPHMSRLEELHFAFSKDLTEECIRMLVTSPNLPNLTKITLMVSGVSVDRAQEIVREVGSPIKVSYN